MRSSKSAWILTILTIPALMLLVSGCKSLEHDSESKNIFGSDNRVKITSNKYPWSAIGKLNSCTATLIAKNLVITAAHCVFDDDGTSKLDSTTFKPNYIDWSSKDTANATYMWYGNKMTGTGTDRHDWAIVKLDKNLGDKYGYMDIKSLGLQDYKYYDINLAGYSGDKYSGTAGVHQDCKIKEGDSDYLYHDCDATRGSSGGPIFYTSGGRAVIVALNVGEKRGGGNSSLKVDYYKYSRSNMAIPASRFITEAKRQGSATPGDTDPGGGNPTGLPRGDHWYSIHPYTSDGLDLDLRKSQIDACLKKLERKLGIRCYRQDFDWINGHCYDSRDREYSMQLESCVDKTFGPFKKPGTGYDKDWKRPK